MNARAVTLKAKSYKLYADKKGQALRLGSTSLTMRRSGQALRLRSGQAIAEILIGFTVVTIILGSAVIALALMLRSNSSSQNTQTAALLAQEYVDAAKIAADGDWHAIYDITPKGATTTYYMAASGTQYAVRSGVATTTSNNVTFTRYFTIENVSRSNGADIDIVYTPGSCPSYPCYDDPSTQKMTVIVQWTVAGRTLSTNVVDYLTRWRNKAFKQSDWDGGVATDTPITVPDNTYSSSTNLDFTSSTGSIILEGF